MYWSKLDKDKEDFAHRYATEFAEREKQVGRIPFARILNEEKLISEHMKLSWFKQENHALKPT